MTAKEAVAKRILDLCAERDMALHALGGCRRGFALHRVQYAEREKPESRRRVPQKAVRRLDISLRAFFDCDLFDDLEQEIQ